MTIRGWIASSYYARTRNSALLVAMLFLACAPSYTRAQAPKAALPQDAAGLVEAFYKPGAEHDALALAIVAKGVQAIPPLLDDAARKPRHERFNMHLIGQMGPKVLPVLLDLTNSPEHAPMAARALSTMVSPASGLPAARLIACVKRPATKNDCGMALVRAVGPKSAAAAPALAELLRSSDRDERLYAAMALKQIGTRVSAASQALHAAVNDPDEEVKGVARRATGWKPARTPAKAGSPGPAEAKSLAPAKVKPEATAVRASTMPHRSAP
jgi:hypothetical protein